MGTKLFKNYHFFNKIINLWTNLRSIKNHSQSGGLRLKKAAQIRI